MNERKEMGVDLMGLNAWNPWKIHNTSPREAMAASMLAQAPVIAGNEPRRIMTGVELEYRDATFNIAFPCDATVLRIIRKFPMGMGRDNLRHNPMTLIVYEDYYDRHKTVGVIEVPEFMSLHQELGHPMRRNPAVWENLHEGANFAKGEILAHSDAVRDDGLYGVGVEAEIAFMSDPATIEDGLKVSQSFANKLAPTTYSTVMATWGQRYFPLNLYGDTDQYKIFPDIGDFIDPDSGIIIGLRERNDNLSIAEMTPRALRTMDHTFDRPLYGKPGARVVDVEVWYDERLNPPTSLMGMNEQAMRYYEATANYYRSLLDIYHRLLARRGKSLRITPEFNRLLVQAQMYLPVAADKRKLSRTYRHDRMDEWWVRITYEHQLNVDVGYKLTDLHGGN